MGRVRFAVRLLFLQLRALVGLSVAWNPPLVGRAARSVFGEPREEESEVGGIPATIFRPARGSGPWPAAVLYPGVTREGRRHSAFVGLGRALAAVGYLTVVAEPDGLAVGELTEQTAGQAREVARAVAARPDVSDGRFALLGVSGGATLALRTAATPGISGRVTSVLAMAPVCDLEEALCFVTTGFRRQSDALVPFVTGSFFQLVSARSVIASLPPESDRNEVLEILRALPDYGLAPLDALEAPAARVFDPGVSAALHLLVNREPKRFDELLEAVPAEVRRSLSALSPVRDAGDIEAPVEIVVARADKYIPLSDALAFASACATARLTILDSLEHVVPHLALDTVHDLARLNGALVRTLATAYSR